ncbi:hypothetical protein BASA83_010278 [Batrachochytrium salamandrivorans]|nr:hypothetical protein BASA83_010278 [Batrachochytrium salamandrivorans]
MRFSVITLPICLIGAISANPHPTGGSGSESVSESESSGNGLDCESNGMYSNSGGKAKVPKGDSFSYKETTKSSSQSSDIKRRKDVLPGYPPQPKEVLHRSFRLSVIKDEMNGLPKYFPDYKEPIQNPSKSSNIKARMDVFPGYLPKPKGVLQKSFKLFLIKKRLGAPKEDDFSSDSSLASKSTSSELSSQDPNSQEDGEVDPTTSSDMFEETPLPDLLVFDHPSAPTRDQQMMAFRIFLSIYNYKFNNDFVYTFGKIREPESKRIEQENMVSYLESLRDTKLINQRLIRCEREIFSFHTSNPNLASKYYEKKRSQNEDARKGVWRGTFKMQPDNGGEKVFGQSLMNRCLIIGRAYIYTQAKSVQARSRLTDDQVRLYRYIAPVIQKLEFQLV